MRGLLDPDRGALDRHHHLDFLVLLHGRVLVDSEHHIAAGQLPANLVQVLFRAW